MTFERVDMNGPETTERLEPVVDLPERVGADAVHSSLCVHARLHEAGVSQNLEVLGDGRLRHAKLLLDVADRLLR